MRRKTFGHLPVALVILSILTACGRASPPRSLIVICIDTLRADHMGAYGYPRETTPQLDLLSRQGARFEHAFSTSNWTVPAVASVLTSVLPSRHGAGVPGAYKNLDKVSPAGFAPGLKSITDVLKDRGFRTGLFSANPFLYGSFRRSFDRVLVKRMPGGELVDAALDWAAEAPQKPFFLYVQLMDAHQPNLPPEHYFDLFETPGAGPRQARHADWSYGSLIDPGDPAFQSFRANRIATYDGSIRYVDDQVRRLLDRLASLDMLRESLVIVYSDHGEEFWDHAVEQAGLRDDPRGVWGIGHGHSMYQELLHVPLIFWSGNRFEPATVSCPVSLVDVAPTALEILGIERPASMTGKTLKGMLEGREDCGRRALIAEEPAYGPDSAAILLWPMKLVRRGNREMLFDLGQDAAERADLATAAPDKTRELGTILDRIERTAREAVPVPEIDPETLKQLRALGYLSH